MFSKKVYDVDIPYYICQDCAIKFSVYHSLPVSHTGIQRVIPYFLLSPVRIPLVPQKPVPPASFPFAFCNYISSMR